MSEIAIKCYKYQQEIAFRPVSNSYLLYLSLSFSNFKYVMQLATVEYHEISGWLHKDPLDSRIALYNNHYETNAIIESYFYTQWKLSLIENNKSF